MQSRQTADERKHLRTERGRAQIRYIVIHGAVNGRLAAGTSVHYIVLGDRTQQQMREQETAWHCGTRGVYYHPYCRNGNSIGVALCSQVRDGRQVFLPGTVRRAQALVRMLMERYGIPAENVLRHYDVTHKTCPVPFVEHAASWTAFRDGLAAPARAGTKAKAGSG